MVTKNISQEDFFLKVYEFVKKIPKGQVRSYGDVARAIAHPHHARHVGYALAALPKGSEVPWHRVINANNQISPRKIKEKESIQKKILENEGIIFDCKGKVIQNAAKL
ncbi:MAG: MGMT family protein [Bdellovibrionales bacterium]|nr:MGMT family protein [Bdellovibrionales bacterium]